MSEKDFMMIIRQALLMIVSAIEKKYGIKSKRVLIRYDEEDPMVNYTTGV